MRMADKVVLEHVLDIFSTIPDPAQAEFIFIVGYLGDKIEDFMHAKHADLKVHFVEQTEMRGQSHAISLARDYLSGSILVIYADTLIETDFSFIATEAAGAVAWVKAVPDPRRFGVAELGNDGWVTHLVEKPQDVDNNLALVGCYYFKSAEELIQAIDEQMDRNIQLENEFFLADAVNVMLEHGLKMRIERVETWMDAGTPEAVLATNRYLLEHGHNNTAEGYTQPTTAIIQPVYIHPSASIENSVIGPHTAVGASCSLRGCIVRDSIIDDYSVVTDVNMEHSLIGQSVHIQGKSGKLNVGDHTELTL
jgi:glucose-1-phosphate thymidylyltransferase